MVEEVWGRRKTKGAGGHDDRMRLKRGGGGMKTKSAMVGG